jgi:branched-chain amino acid aminotransferase
MVYECTTSNIFAFVGKRLITPGRRILAGITRGVVLQMAERLFSIEVRDLPFEEFIAADEIFITGTNKGIVPVVRVDDVVIGEGRPGPNTCQLMAALKTHTRDHGRPQDRTDHNQRKINRIDGENGHDEQSGL